MIGPGGTGKSTLAARMGAITGLPVIHLDSIFWRPGWEPTPKDEWARTVRALLAREAWVMDGNYSGTLDARLAACDAVVFLDLPRRTYLRRAVLRRLRHLGGRTRSDMAPGCPEQLSWEFVRWLWGYRNRQRPAVLKKLEAAAARGLRVLILRSPAEVERFVAELPRLVEADAARA